MRSLKNAFTFSLSRLNVFFIDKRLLSIKAYILGGMFPLTTLTRLMFILMLGIVFLTLKLARPENIFKTSQKHTKFKHSNGNSLRGLTLGFYVRSN